MNRLRAGLGRPYVAGTGLMPTTYPIGSVLFAETDPRALATFPALLAERLPKVQLEICNTVDEAADLTSSLSP